MKGVIMVCLSRMVQEKYRGLIDICIGLVKGVGKHFHEDLKVTKLSDDRIRVVFPR